MSNAWLYAIGVVAIASCGDNTAGLERPSVPVVERADPASVADCPHGGSIVSSGRDDNGNSALDDDEIEKRTAVCNDPPGETPPTIVVRLLPEPAGLNCRLDGTAVQSGLDLNRNGRLDDDEVTRVEYACGEVLRTRLVAEPAGARCAAGGVAVLIGRDRDHDGELGDDEIEQTDLECGTELSRDIAVHTADEVAALASVTVISGSLTVAQTGLAELTLPRLVQVRGALEVKTNVQLAHVAMPALQSVDGRMSLDDNNQLTAVELPALHRVGSLLIAANGALADLSGLSALTDVIHDFQISGNGSLASADLPLTDVGGDVIFTGNSRLTHIRYTADGSGNIRIASNSGLETLELPSNGFRVRGVVQVLDNGQLAHVKIEANSLAGLLLDENDRLVDASLRAFEIDGDLEVMENGSAHVALIGATSFGLTVAGSVHVAGPLDALDLQTPLRVTGDFTLGGTQVSSLGSPSAFLQVAGSVAVSFNAHLIVIWGIVVGGGLEVRGNGSLATLNFLFQDEIDGDLTIAENAALAEAPSLEALRRIRGNVRIASNPVLKAAFGPALEQVDGSLVFDDNDRLSDLGLGRLVSAGSLSIAHADALTEIVLPALTSVAAIDVRSNGALHHLAAPVLRSADLGVFDNPHLPACEVAALFAVVLGEDHQSGNDETAECP